MLIETLKVISKHFNHGHFFCIFKNREECYQHSHHLLLTQNTRTNDAIPSSKQKYIPNRIAKNTKNNYSPQFKVAANRLLRNMWMHRGRYSESHLNAVIQGLFHGNNNYKRNISYDNKQLNMFKHIYRLLPCCEYNYCKYNEMCHVAIRLLRPLLMYLHQYSQQHSYNLLLTQNTKDVIPSSKKKYITILNRIAKNTNNNYSPQFKVAANRYQYSESHLNAAIQCLFHSNNNYKRNINALIQCVFH